MMQSLVVCLSVCRFEYSIDMRNSLCPLTTYFFYFFFFFFKTIILPLFFVFVSLPIPMNEIQWYCHHQHNHHKLENIWPILIRFLLLLSFLCVESATFVSILCTIPNIHHQRSWSVTTTNKLSVARYKKREKEDMKIHIVTL